MRQIGETPLLTPDEEKLLGWTIVNNGDECDPLQTRARSEAIDKMIKSNLRLVISISKHYAHRGLSLADLVEEGNVGLIRAAQGFDPAQGARFSTYASWWIKQSIKRTLINAQQPIHIPAYMVELIARWKVETRKFEAKHSRPPSIAELSKEMGIPVRKLNIVKKAISAYHSPNQAPKAAGGEEPNLGDLFTDTRTLGPEEKISSREDFMVILRLLDSIDHRDAHVLRLRFGLEGQEPLTLKEIGEQVGLTRERVRQIEVDALKKLYARMMDDKPLRFSAGDSDCLEAESHKPKTHTSAARKTRDAREPKRPRATARPGRPPASDR
jgi:RNA polymerase primary sigma factor